MKAQSRRGFIESCLALGGMAGPLACLAAGCRKEEGAVPETERSHPDGAVPDRPSDRAAEPVADDDPDAPFEPGYVKLHRKGELKKRGEALWSRMSPCKLCPRSCGVDRLEGEKGFCQAPSELVISSHHPHFGEEPPLVGRGGSGTVFFSHCALRCVFCINYEISLLGQGSPASIEDLARMMLRLQSIGCVNINVVTPTHYSPHIVLALDIAAGRGLRLPLVYNTCGWEQLEILRILDGVVDIYLPDFKYASGEMAVKYSTCVPPDTRFLESEAGARYSATDIYPELTKMALLEMHRQVGVARPGADGLVRRGLMIRHLVMPNNVGGSKEVLRWIAASLPKDTYVNVMSQYTPMYRAHEFPDINRGITRAEYREAVEAAREAGLTNLDVQGYRFL
jgi:putative pyruvate formate lyase activating enzyme